MDALQKMGFPTDDHQFEEGGFLSWAKHRFGDVVCSVKSDGEIVHIYKGDELIAEDGFFGREAILLREEIERATSARIEEEDAEKDAAIDHARKEYERLKTSARKKYAEEERRLEELQAEALQSVRDSYPDREALSALGVREEFVRAAEKVAQPASADARNAPVWNEPEAAADGKPGSEATEAEGEQGGNASTDTRPPEDPSQPALTDAKWERLQTLVRKGSWTRAQAVLKNLRGKNLLSPQHLSELEQLALARVRPIPASKVRSNRNGYKFLVSLVPDNPYYKQKFEHYAELASADAAAVKRVKSGDPDKRAIAKLEQQRWIMDAGVSPAHMNIYVLPNEKNWKSPTIGLWACAVLQNSGSDLKWVRFVDAPAVVYRGESNRSAQLSKFRCD